MTERVHRARTVRRTSTAMIALLAAGAIGLTSAFAQTTIDRSKWSPEYVREIAGTLEVDTAAECSEVTPLDYEGKVTFWYVGPTEAEPDLHQKMDADFWAAFAETYPNIETTVQNINYNQMLDKLRTAALGRAAPMMARMPILWGVEFAAKGFLQQMGPEDVGYTVDEFWPGAMKSVTWEGDTYGIPTNNETMALIWNAALFEEAGLDPEKAPDTWDQLVEYSKQIKEKTGKPGYGLVARVNAGNTPFRFMPVMWAYGGGALDEAEDNPTYDKVFIGNEGSKGALEVAYDLYVRDKSVPVSALTNTQTENQDPFVAGQLGMMIAHPAEYATMLDRAAKATGADKEIADKVVSNMRYGLIPEGPKRRSVVFGGSNIHMFKDEFVDGGSVDKQAALALACFMTSPEWSTKLSWVISNPGNLRGFATKWNKERLDSIKFLDVATSMLPYGVPFPVIPESTEIMNIIVPDMLQNALTEKMSVDEALENADREVEELRSGL